MSIKSVCQVAFVAFTIANLCSAQLINQALTYSPPNIENPRQARILQQGPPLAINDPSELAHPSVVANSISESQYSPELLKSHRFYSNPATAAALASESW